MSDDPTAAPPAGTSPTETEEPAAPAAAAPPAAAADPTASATAPPSDAVPVTPDQSSLSTPPEPPPPAEPSRGLSYAVDIVFCIDVTGSMTPIIDQVKANALRFYDDVQTNLTAKGKNVDTLRVRVVAFRDFKADGEAALQESPFFTLPSEQTRSPASSTVWWPRAAETHPNQGSRRSPWPSTHRGRRAVTGAVR